MTDTKFTPGFWEVRIEQILPTSKAECFTVATDNFDIISPMLGIRNEQDANLIAAAPDLYSALDEAVKDLVGYQWNVRTALKSDSRWAGVSELIQQTIDQSRAALAKARGKP